METSEEIQQEFISNKQSAIAFIQGITNPIKEGYFLLAIFEEEEDLEYTKVKWQMVKSLYTHRMLQHFIHYLASIMYEDHNIRNMFLKALVKCHKEEDEYVSDDLIDNIINELKRKTNT